MTDGAQTPQGQSGGIPRRSVAEHSSSLPVPSRRLAPGARYGTPSSLSSATKLGEAGPLGAYRNLSKYSASMHTPLRSSRSTSGASQSLGKRSYSATDDAAFATPQSTRKRSIVETDASPPHPSTYELTMLRTEYDKRIQSEQHAYRLLETQFRSQSRELEALKQQRVEVLNEWESERAAQRKAQEAWANDKKELEEQLTALRSESLHQRSVAESQRSDAQEKEANAQARISALESERIALQTAAQEAQAQNDLLQQTNTILREKNAALAAAQDDMQRSMAQPADAEELSTLKEQLSQQISAVQRLELVKTRLGSENARLREASAHTEILREANRSLEVKVERMDSLRNEILAKEEQIAAMVAQETQWAESLRHGIATDEHAAFVAAANVEASVPQVDAPSSMTRETLPHYVSTLRGTIMGLGARVEGLVHSVEQLRTSNLELDRRAQRGSENESSLAKELSDKTGALLHAQKAVEVERDELRRCKELLSSFETEASQSPNFDEIQAKRIAQLEALVGQAQQENTSLSTRIADMECEALARAAQPKDAPACDPSALKEAHEKLALVTSQYQELESQAAAAAKENDKLWARVGRGEFDQSRVKCLVLGDNPVSRDYAIRSATLDALRKENEELLQQVQALQEAGTVPQPAAAEGDALVPLQTVENLRNELHQLQETIQLKDKGMLRLKQVFTAKANEFREAVQSLFGYKLRFMENGKVKLTSAYARGARSTTLIFSSEEGNVGEMKLQGEAADGLANVAHLRDYWLSDGIRHSVPCFLAALNLELYENTTQAIRGSFGALDEAASFPMPDEPATLEALPQNAPEEAMQILSHLTRHKRVRGCATLTTDARVLWSGGPAFSSGQVSLDAVVQFVREMLETARRNVEAIEADDELNLLRIRTKHYEMLVTPSQKYVLVVVQEPGTA
ncbi:[phosphatase 2A protein]-leucine-carboxy methyltransferase [Malassezia vespertilionis]|uniref:[phosphatase 2A protein]-leucine-carboxy methyltransferase n=1 Tax=Malassezia vespertilionis TaxID=2020962 RepID=UPI0024B0FFED|nr:[phosphatase 2A protein]-leucine-carboxy methyltransferase [Malassezia vespertilionis]WFD08515.1 [phosphatase 2A protein]-leucine-carboxy methyltransferase [Malassezia vespertilionis]